MAGSTTSDQSIFDAPVTVDGTDDGAATRQTPQSSESPPDTDGMASESQNVGSGEAGADGIPSESQNPKQKRIACIICRRRKLKCDGARPRCSTCTRLRHDCGYDETRKKSGPKRGYVKHLEQRLKQIENQLKSDGTQPRDKSSSSLGAAFHGFDPMTTPLGGGLLGAGRSPSMDPGMAQGNADGTDGMPWEMVRLGLEEPLPPEEIINELHNIYFEKLHISMPMIHRYRYLAAMNLAPSMRPPPALRYAIWAYACSASEKYLNFKEIFYQRARKYAEMDEVRGFGEQIFTVSHVQAWVIIANYEFKMLYFPRAWMSVGRAVRLGQMLGLYRVDGGGLEVKECIGAPKEWVEKEERRRTFWAAYCFDRWASIGTGWPMNIDERDIHTHLPVSDEAFEKRRPETGTTLAAILKGGDPSTLSSYSSVVLMASIIGKALTHLHRTDGREDGHDTESGDFWKRHQYLDHILTNTNICLPEHLRLVTGITDPNVIFLHMNIQSTAICLHQAAILKAEQNNLPGDIIKNSTERCYLAATEIANIWRKISSMDISYLSPYVAFCLFVGARVFVHAYRKNPEDENTRRSLHFLLNAMEAHRKRNDITESFLKQLLVDLDEMGFESPVLQKRAGLIGKRDTCQTQEDDFRCAPVMPRHSTTQPTFQDFQVEAEQRRMATLFNNQVNSATMSADSPQLDIPIRSGGAGHQLGMEGQRPLPQGQLHSVSLGQEYDLGVQYSQRQGLSPGSNQNGYANQTGFGLSSLSASSTGHSPASQGALNGMGQDGGPQHHDFYGGDFDMNMITTAFDIPQDTSMMQDLQGGQWSNMNTNFPDGTQTTPAAAWAAFI